MNVQPAAAGFAVSPVDGARVTCHFCPHAPLIVPITNSIKPLLQGTGLCLADLGQSRLQDWCLLVFFACFTMVRVPVPARRMGAVLMSLSPCQAQLPGGLVIGDFFPSWYEKRHTRRVGRNPWTTSFTRIRWGRFFFSLGVLSSSALNLEYSSPRGSLWNHPRLAQSFLGFWTVWAANRNQNEDRRKAGAWRGEMDNVTVQKLIPFLILLLILLLYENPFLEGSLQKPSFSVCARNHSSGGFSARWFDAAQALRLNNK